MPLRLFSGKSAFLMCSAALFPFLLNSCGGGNLPVVKATPPNVLGAIHYIPDDDIDVRFYPSVVSAPDGGVTMLRLADMKNQVLEHYSSDTLGVDWTVPIPRKKGDAWNPYLHYQNGLVECAGIGYYSGGDSTGIRFMTIDPRSHQIKNEKWAGQGESQKRIAFKGNVLSWYMTEPSPDSTILLFYRIAKSDAVKNNMQERKIHGDIYQVDGTLRRSFDLSLSVPEGEIEDYDETGFKHMQLKIDNEGNLFLLSFLQTGEMQVTKYLSGDITKPVVLTVPFRNADFASGFTISKPSVSFDKESGLLLVSAARKKNKGISLGFIHVSFDFTSRLTRSFQYDPREEELKKLIDESDLEGYDVFQTIRDDAHKKTVLMAVKTEKNISMRDHPFSYYTGLLIMGFDDNGKPLWQYAAPKDQDHKIEYYITTPAPSKVGIFYVDHHTEIEGLENRELDIAEGTLTPEKNILQFESNTYFLKQYTLWPDRKNAFMLAAGYTSMTNDYTTQMRNPVIFRLSMP